ncbi:MAG: stage III sporulation protein AA [Oscillospiraceae bacterium]|nr:stage III sporulation protein AA [Oscillospiraceae bacterium]
MNSTKNFRKVLEYLPEKLSCSLKKIPSATVVKINEIRLRANRPVSVSVAGESVFVSPNGSLTRSPTLGINCSAEDISEAFHAVCDYSVHSHQRDISQGFITLEGGNRVGICGTAVGQYNSIETLKFVSSLNFRIAGEIIGCGEEICRKLFGAEPMGVLIIGVPLSGKTTVLRDMCRILGNRYRLSIVDERSEIASCYHGVPQNDVGFFTDVLDGYDKKNGIETAVRVMSPQIVVCDETGGRTDCEAILESVTSGVKILASAHGKSIDEVLQRKHIKKLVSCGIFDYAVLLGNGSDVGTVKEIRKIGGLIC